MSDSLTAREHSSLVARVCVRAYVPDFLRRWPFCTYTVTGWTLLTLRYICSVVGLTSIASIIRFPSMCMATITVVVWWGVLFPAFMSMLDAEGKTGFLRFNKNGLLINLHLLNLPLALLDVYIHPRTLTLFDLWVAFLIAFLYMMFYVLVLDRRGIHIYIIFSPRTAFFAVSVAAVAAMYAGVFRVLGAYSSMCLNNKL